MGENGKKKRLWPYIAAIAGGLCLLSLVLLWFHPLAPLLLWASVLLQAPIIYLISRTNYDAAYRERQHQRREAYEKDGDAAAFLAQEEHEATSFGYRLLTAKSRSDNRLNCAELLLALNRPPAEAEALLQALGGEKLNEAQATRLSTLQEQLQTKKDTEKR